MDKRWGLGLFPGIDNTRNPRFYELKPFLQAFGRKESDSGLPFSEAAACLLCPFFIFSDIEF